MGYIDKAYIGPFLKALQQWKLLLYSMLIDFSFYLLTFGIFYATFSIIGYFMLPLNSHNLIDYVTFFQNVSLYTTQIEYFIIVLFAGSSICLLLSFLSYSVSRTMIWNRILKIKGNYLRNLMIDGIIFIILFMLLFFGVMYLKSIYINWFLVLIIFPLLYYLFLSHIHLSCEKIKKIFKNAFSFDLLYLLPHLIVMLFVLIILLSLFFTSQSFIGLILSVILILLWTSFFRIYSKEIIFSLENK